MPVANSLMEKSLKYGIVFMFLAILLLPAGVFLKSYYSQLSVAVLIIAMCLELIGLIFVIVGIIQKKKNTKA